MKIIIFRARKILIKSMNEKIVHRMSRELTEKRIPFNCVSYHMTWSRNNSECQINESNMSNEKRRYWNCQIIIHFHSWRTTQCKLYSLHPFSWHYYSKILISIDGRFFFRIQYNTAGKLDQFFHIFPRWNLPNKCDLIVDRAAIKFVLLNAHFQCVALRLLFDWSQFNKTKKRIQKNVH